MKEILYPIAFILLIYGNLTAQQKIINKKILQNEWSKLEIQAKEIQKVSPNLGLSATLIYKGKTIAQYCSGYATKSKSLMMNNKVIYQWEAISKIVTSITVLQLVEKHQLNLNDPVTQYIPLLGSNSKHRDKFSKIKIHHLVNNASNIDWISLQDNLDKRFPKGEVVSLTEAMRPFLKHATIDHLENSGERVRLKGKPNQGYLTANGDYALLEMIIETVSKQPFAEYVKKNIFKPLKMSTAHYGSTPKHLQKLLSEPSLERKNNYNIIPLRGKANASKSLKASGNDLLKLLDFLKFRRRKADRKRYERIVPWQVLKKYYYDVNVNNPESYHIVSSKKTSWVMVSAFGMLHGNNAFIGQMGVNSNYLLLFLTSIQAPIGVLYMVKHRNVQSQKEWTAIIGLITKISDFMQTYKFN